jgi:pantothenate kinase
MSAVISHKEAGLERITQLIAKHEERYLLGIVGKPGAGKSTLSQYLIENLNGSPVTVVPMDGYHLSNSVLQNLGRTDRKGAPDTFDVQGFTALLRRIRDEKDTDIYYPVFDRSIEESIAAQGLVKSDTELVIVEGNYLLHEEGGWESVASLLDEVWFIEIDDETRLRRLIDRHIAFGKSPEAAESWSRGSDEVNAQIIAKSKARAHAVIQLD